MQRTRSTRLRLLNPHHRAKLAGLGQIAPAESMPGRGRTGAFLSRYGAWIAGGAALLAGGVGLAIAFRKEIGVLASKVASTLVAAGKDGAFAAVLPRGVSSYASQILIASRKYGVSPWLIAGVMYRESTGGLALKPPGPRGTGDFLPRTARSSWFKFADPNTGLPPDGLGWGRGLMQIDYGAHNAWVRANDWGDPQTSIDYATSILADRQRYFLQAAGGPITVDAWRLKGLTSANGQVIVRGWTEKYGLQSTGPFRDPRPLSGGKLIEATLASYNAGPGGVLQALAAGLPPSAATAGNDYADWIITHVASWASRFS